MSNYVYMMSIYVHMIINYISYITVVVYFWRMYTFGSSTKAHDYKFCAFDANKSLKSSSKRHIYYVEISSNYIQIMSNYVEWAGLA